ncbi:MAG: FtsK/SpoIIIE domain-containing protein [Planctomycetaceae bacterium]|nr:FtsK/SpoIIIE domain-containing protein [Planctomycetaceae bacterium]
MPKQIPFKANVSDLHLCRRCPRLLALKLSGKSNAWQVGLQGESFCGKIFHNDVAAPFHRDAAGQKGVKKRREILDLFKNHSHNPDELKKELLTLVYRNYLSPYLDVNSQTLSTSQIESLGRCIVKWGDFLTDFFCGNSDDLDNLAAFVNHAFLPPEKILKSQYTAGDGSILTVSGKFDCALLDRTHGEVLLVEFKCLRETDVTEELAQMALYAWLIRENTGLSPRTCVLYLEEEKPAATFSATETAGVIALLPQLFENAIHVIRAVHSGEKSIPKTDHPQLCNECPYREDCDVRFGNILSVPDGHSEADDHLQRLVDYLGKHRLPVEPVGYINGPRFIRLKINPRPEKGVTVAKIQRLANDMKVGLDLANPPLIQAQSGYVSVDVPRRNIKPLLLSPLIRDGEATRPDSDVAVPVGAEIDGKTFWLNFADPAMSSVLIGGTSGSGKSVLLQSLVLGLRLANPNVRTEFTLIDPKRVTFMKIPLEKIDAELICDPQPALERLTQLVEEMEQRYCLLESEKCFDIEAYNLANSQTPLTHHVTVIDEFADLMVDKKANKELELVIQRLGQKGRAAGFHLVLATQRPEAKVISPLIKANLQVKIAMKVTSQANSKIILDEDGAECLIGNGDMLLGGSVKPVRLQGAWASATDYEALTRCNRLR